MSPEAVMLAAAAGLVLAGSTVSLFALWRAHNLLYRGKRPGWGASEAAIEVLQLKIDELEREIHDLRQRSTASILLPAHRAGINLDKRSQALRMNRRGETPAEIAAALDIPLQEVELLLKVHRIVLSSF